MQWQREEGPNKPDLLDPVLDHEKILFLKASASRTQDFIYIFKKRSQFFVGTVNIFTIQKLSGMTKTSLQFIHECEPRKSNVISQSTLYKGFSCLGTGKCRCPGPIIARLFSEM